MLADARVDNSFVSDGCALDCFPSGLWFVNSEILVIIKNVRRVYERFLRLQ